MSRPVFVINFKNYPEVMGEGSLKLARSASRAAEKLDVELILAPPVPSLAWVASSVRLPVYSQKVEDAEEGKSTGAVIPEALRGWSCKGSIINHSESRTPMAAISRVIPRMREAKLSTCACAESSSEVSELAVMEPEMIAIEPRDLIGTGIAVSKARPGLVADSVAAARAKGFKGRVLCGAGIVTGEDVEAALKLGADGILVASAVVRAKDWDAKILELGESLVRARA
jgi:triosephosphate isomerase (TIM)